MPRFANGVEKKVPRLFPKLQRPEAPEACALSGGYAACGRADQVQEAAVSGAFVRIRTMLDVDPYR